MSGQENVVPIDENAAYHRSNLEFADWLKERFEKNEIASLCVRGVDDNGEPIKFDIVALNAETMRFVMIGMLTEATAELTAGHEAC